MTSLNAGRGAEGNSDWGKTLEPSPPPVQGNPGLPCPPDFAGRPRAKAALAEEKQSYETLFSFIRARGYTQHFQPDSTILLHEEPANVVYLIETGTVRSCTIDSFGHRQIFAFPRKGELVGISDTDRWHFTAEAVDHVVVKSLSRTVLEQELAVNTALRQESRAYIRALLAQREKQLLMLSHSKGPQRLLDFLVTFAASRPSTGYIALPMSRRDIADHIGLSTESVSRAFSHLKRTGRIDLKTPEKFKII